MTPSELSSFEAIREASRSMILSASGWRKVFAPTGDEEERGTSISEADAALVTLAAAAFHRFLGERGLSPADCRGIVIGCDTRPTGRAILERMASYLLAAGYRLATTGVAAAPEIMAHTSMSDDLSAFIYISASHNPVGHNGLKFGLSTGGVLDRDDAELLIRHFQQLVEDPELMKTSLQKGKSVSEEDLLMLFQSQEGEKKAALDHYMEFAGKTSRGNRDYPDDKTFFALLREESRLRSIGVVGELNGSARCLSIDADFFRFAGIKARFFNDRAGEIVHRIVPEGKSLEPAMELLEAAYREDHAYSIAYVPDNDGDRGNIVYISKTGKARILEAQEVFALAVLSELSFQSWLDEHEGIARGQKIDRSSSPPLAVAVNGPTSMRIDQIAHLFGAKVFRAEVGEANVVNLAKEKRREGFRVPILGEGSNGGNITHPSAVRDPLSTVMALVKLLVLRGRDGHPGLFQRWLSLSGREHDYHPDFNLEDIIESLPRFTTTSAYEDRAILRLGSFSHGALKASWEELFLQEWDIRAQFLREAYGVYSYRILQYEGTAEREGIGRKNRSGKETGGLKALFLDASGTATDCIWMRGSGTEPVFRLLADCKGNDRERESFFLQWQRDMIKGAYRRIE